MAKKIDTGLTPYGEMYKYRMEREQEEWNRVIKILENNVKENIDNIDLEDNNITINININKVIIESPKKERKIRIFSRKK